jgi:spore photoproduct lyase
VLPQVVGCPLDCSYCILQQYQNRGEITVRADPEPILDELVSELSRQPRRLQRVCTGQVGDSLALEPEVGFAAAAVRRFAGLDNAVLELKTKTDRVESLLGLEHGGRTILSWSLAPQEVAAAEEHGAASLPARLRAARRAAGAGYLLAFHLDPLVTVDGDPRPHLKVLGQLASAVPADSVAYLSLGTVRFHPSMRRSVRGRFAGSRVALAELLPDVDGKLRLAPPLRVQLYRELAREVRRILPETFLYLCMEPPRVWRQALGVEHTHRREVELALARSLDRRYGLAPCKPLPEAYAED